LGSAAITAGAVALLSRVVAAFGVAGREDRLPQRGAAVWAGAAGAAGIAPVRGGHAIGKAVAEGVQAGKEGAAEAAGPVEQCRSPPPL
jgi:hypothetical protein